MSVKKTRKMSEKTSKSLEHAPSPYTEVRIYVYEVRGGGR